MNKTDSVSYVFYKVRVYFTYTLAIILPACYGFIRFDNFWYSFAFALVGGMIMLHLLITQDNKDAHKEQKLLIMRKRHFKDITQK
jgi:hypothetical protein